jgi:UDP-glucose 4-epimerase
MKCIVTGGAGFIGCHLSYQLVRMGHEVTIIDNFSTGRKSNLMHFKDDIEIIEADISKLGDWIKSFEKTDWVFHLASLADIVPSIQFPQDYFESNVVGTFNVVQACKKNKIRRLLYAASGSCYGIPKHYPTSENSEINTEYPYALTKYLGEQIVLNWAKVYKLQAISLRLFNVYGTKSRTSGTYGAVFGVFIAQKLNNKPFTIVGNGKQTRDFTYVSDVVDAFILAAKSNITGEIFNIGSGKDVSVNKIVELLEAKEKVNIPKRPGEPDRTFADIKKITKYLKWKPKVSIEEGIKKMLEDIDYWKEAPVWDPKKIEVATKDWFKYLEK